MQVAACFPPFASCACSAFRPVRASMRFLRINSPRGWLRNTTQSLSAYRSFLLHGISDSAFLNCISSFVPYSLPYFAENPMQRIFIVGCSPSARRLLDTLYVHWSFFTWVEPFHRRWKSFAIFIIIYREFAISDSMLCLPLLVLSSGPSRWSLISLFQHSKQIATYFASAFFLSHLHLLPTTDFFHFGASPFLTTVELPVNSNI